LILNLCHGKESLQVEKILLGLERGEYSCSDWPATVPLSAFEVLSTAVLIKGMLLCRLLRLHQTYGPLLLMLQRMVNDMVMWVFMTAIVVISFTSAFHTLYSDTYDYRAAALNRGDEVCENNMDDLFEQWSQAFQIMIEVLLSADGQFDCLRQSSNSSVAVVFMYFYVLITCVMLVNMLIALMAKTFDNVFEQQATQFLYIKAATMSVWLNYPAAPPPLNLFGLPYHACACVVHVIRLFCCRSEDRKDGGMHGLAGKEFVPPSSFLSELVPMAPMTRASPVNPLHKASVMVNKAVSAGLIADGLTHSILDFVQEHSDSVVREDRWKTTMMRLVFAKAAETKGDLADVQAKIDEVHRAVRSLRQGSLRPEPVWEGSPNEDGGAPLGVEHQHGANGTLSEEEDVQKLRNRISELEMHSEELRENLSVARVQLSTYREEAAQLAEFEANELAKMLAGPGKQTRSSTHVLGGLSKRNGAASATTVQLQGDQQNVLSFNTCANPSEPPSAVPVATVSAIRCEPPTFWEVAPRANGDAAGSPGERPQAGRPTNPKVSALSMLRKQQDVQRAIVAPHPQPARPATRFAVL